MRLATFNILHGRSIQDGVVDLDRLADAIRLLDADILALQEVDRDQPRSHLADLTAVAAEAMGAVTHRFAAALSGTPGLLDSGVGERPSGRRVLWDRLALALSVGFLAGSAAAANPDPRPAVSAHPPKNAHREGGAASCGDRTSAHPGGIGRRCQRPPVLRSGLGRLQLRRIRRDLAPLKEPVILMGDLNMPDGRPAQITGYRPLARHYTFPVDKPDRQLDHILMRGRLGHVTASSAPALPLSDHRALVVDLSVPRPEPPNDQH